MKLIVEIGSQLSLNVCKNIFALSVFDFYAYSYYNVLQDSTVPITHLKFKVCEHLIARDYILRAAGPVS